jgi:acyl-coenzyme A thioesterase PaaI-like protein
MTESIFTVVGDRFVATEQARGPWDPQALHGGAPAALIASAFERVRPGADLHLGRLSFEFLRPIPLAPLTLATRVVRPGRRVQELAAELAAGDETIVRASALRMTPVSEEVAAATPQPLAGEDGTLGAPMAPPSDGEPARFALDGGTDASFAGTAMEMRWLSDPRSLGPGRVWMRLRHPLLPGETTSSLARLVATADFGNGVSAALPFDRFLFMNADLTIHLQRPPQGEWIGLDARTLLLDGGVATAESVLHDELGALGRAFQTLVAAPR